MLLTADVQTASLGASEDAKTAITPLLDVLGLADPHEYIEHATDVRWEALQRTIVEQAEDLVANNPHSAMAWARLAQACHNAGDEERAIESARRVLSVSDTDASAAYVAAMVLAATGQVDEAEQALTDLDPTDSRQLLAAALAAQRGDFEVGLERLEALAGPAAANLRGWLYLQLDLPNKAIAQFRVVLAEGAPSPDVLMNMAYAHAALGSLNKAVRAASQGVALAPANSAVSFALVRHLLNAGQVDASEAELNRLSTVLGGDDPDIVLLRGTVALRRGNEMQALRTLRSGRNVKRGRNNQRAIAELNANIAFFEWRTGQRSRPQLLTLIRRELERAAGESVGLVSMLSDVLSRTTGADEVEDEISRAAEYHNREELLPAITRLAHMRADFELELATAKEWSKADPINPLATAALIHLVGQLNGLYSHSADMGLKALRRTPNSFALRNNTAYSLAMAGRGQEALDVISVLKPDSITASLVLTATEGLAHLALGQIEVGCEKYREAAKSASEVPDATEATRLAALVGMNLLIAAKQLDVADDVAACGGPPGFQLPNDWLTDPQFLLLQRVASRHGLSWVS